MKNSPTIVIAGVCSVTALAVLAQTRPKAIEDLERLRAGLQTGEVRISIIDNQLPFGPTPRERFVDVRFAGESHITTNRGDAQGVTVWTTEGTPSELDGRLPTHTFQSRGLHIYRPERPTSWMIVRQENSRSQDDIRTLGLSAQPSNNDVHDTLWRRGGKNPSAAEYSSRVEDGLLVTEIDRGGSKDTYWLDPRRGNTPIRVREEYSSGGWSESRTTSNLFDGVWFPAAVEYYSSKFKDGQVPARIVRVLSANFNHPDHASRLSPADMGAEPGVMSTMFAGGKRIDGRWDGEKVVTMQEFADRLARGEIKEGPRFLEELRRTASDDAVRESSAVDAGRMNDFDPRKFESLWEKYVRQFIEKYRLNEDQSQRAMTILKDCQERAGEYVRKQRARFEELDASRKSLQAMDASERAAKAEQLTECEAKLRQPIDEIFEQSLKPRLDTLPTRAQRDAAGENSKNTPKNP